MALKPTARKSFIQQLSKAIREENIENIELDTLSDKKLKELYLKLQMVKSGRFCYGVKKGGNFEEDLKNNNLQYVSFRDTYKFGVRRMTFKEFLILEGFAKNNPSCRYLEDIKNNM